jgi:tetratricopeptide (TPR) repeat protein
MISKFKVPLSLALLGVSLGAFAGEKPVANDEDLESIAGKRLPGLQLKEPTFVGPTVDMLQENPDRPYSNLVYTASKALDISPEYVHRTQEGINLVYLRKYKEARKHFEKLDEDIPGTAISAVVDTLVWQALMIENFDFRYEKQYFVSNQQAVSELKSAIKANKHRGWSHFLMAAMTGVEAIHLVRRSKYVQALSKAFSATDHAQSAKEHAPDFVDLGLAEGMYNYWRTVITMSSSVLPDFGDQRSLGIEQLQKVEQEGFFLRPAATLALTFSWLEERKSDKAIAACEKNRRLFPDNVINNLLTGQAYIQARKYPKAIDVFDHLIKVDPKNNRVHYYRGLTLLKSGKLDPAISAFKRYLQSDHLEEYQLAYAHYRLGQAFYRQKKYGQAELHYKASIKVNGFKAAKRSLSRMKELKKEGRIQY